MIAFMCFLNGVHALSHTRSFIQGVYRLGYWTVDYRTLTSKGKIKEVVFFLTFFFIAQNAPGHTPLAVDSRCTDLANRDEEGDTRQRGCR